MPGSSGCAQDPPPRASAPGAFPGHAPSMHPSTGGAPWPIEVPRARAFDEAAEMALRAAPPSSARRRAISAWLQFDVAPVHLLRLIQQIGKRQSEQCHNGIQTPVFLRGLGGGVGLVA